MEHHLYNPLEVKCRADAETRLIAGYAAVFYDGSPGTQFELWPGGVIERIERGAFDKVLRSRSLDVVAVFHHEMNSAGAILGRTRNDTLKLSVDERGLKYEVTPPDTTAANDLIKLIQRGDVFGSSLGFLPAPKGERLSIEKGRQVISVREVGYIRDVGPTPAPAYKGTTAQVRSDWEQRFRAIQPSNGISIRLRAIEVDAKLKGCLR